MGSFRENHFFLWPPQAELAGINRRHPRRTNMLSAVVGKFTRLRRDGYALSQGCKATNDHVYAYGWARELG
jgi:hypothetical protein